MDKYFPYCWEKVFCHRYGYLRATVLETKRYTAAEIAQMNLPGLPSTKSNVITRAKNEGWEYVEEKGVGGTRKKYAVPARYLPATEGMRVEESVAEYKVERKIAGTIAAGSAQVDPQKLELAIRALGEWEVERGVKVSDERRPAVIAVLYDYLQKAEGEGTDAMALMLRALG